MEVEPDSSALIRDMVAALEQATLMAKQLPTADPSQSSQIHAALHYAYHHLSQFFAQHPPPHRAIHPENSVSSAGGGREENGETAGEPMQIGDDGDEDEQNSRAPPATTVDRMEEKMRDCFIQNKRPKRRLSPSAEIRGRYDDEAIGAAAPAAALDPIGTKLKSLELIYQFHA